MGAVYFPKMAMAIFLTPRVPTYHREPHHRPSKKWSLFSCPSTRVTVLASTNRMRPKWHCMISKATSYMVFTWLSLSGHSPWEPRSHVVRKPRLHREAMYRCSGWQPKPTASINLQTGEWATCRGLNICVLPNFICWNPPPRWWYLEVALLGCD